jgi:hypothetical protein
MGACRCHEDRDRVEQHSGESRYPRRHHDLHPVLLSADPTAEVPEKLMRHVKSLF